ncbi:MAG: hypothetical protein U9N49_00670 [Campylobacterota bacterium]|nr:hypothetical protein [Campylobacterota bacterium]
MLTIDDYREKLDRLKEELVLFDLNRADEEYAVLSSAFNTLYHSGILEITHLEKVEQGRYKLELFTMLSEVSGALSFLVIQILAAYNIMNKYEYAKREHYFAKKCGIAINHLRAPRRVVEASKVDGGYSLNGTLTWASGYQIFDTLLVGFHYEDREYEAMVAFEAQEGMEIGETDSTFVGYGLNTVHIELRDFFVKDEEIVSTNPIGNYTRNKSVSKTVHFCIYGLGVGAIANAHDECFKDDATQKLERIKTQFMDSSDPDELDKLRVELFVLVQDIVTTAMILIGGRSILNTEILQRIYRELIMFNANGLNSTLKELFKDRFLKEEIE